VPSANRGRFGETGEAGPLQEFFMIPHTRSPASHGEGVEIPLAINAEMIEARIREMNDAIRLLRELTSRPYGELTKHEILAMRYLVIQLVEAASSACLHLLAAQGERAEGYPECFLRISQKGVVPEGLGSRLASAARLRNLLVHRYWKIDDERVFESVKDGLRDFEEFVRILRGILDSGPMAGR